MKTLASVLFAFASLGACDAASAAVRKVPQQFTTISAAITAANDGDEIVVSKGTYEENLNVNAKSDLTLRAKGKVIVRGVDMAAPFVPAPVVFLHNSPRIVFRGFRVVAPPTFIGTRIDNCADGRIASCRFDGGNGGVLGVACPGLAIESCSFFDVTGENMTLIESDALVANNTFVRPTFAAISVDDMNAEIRGNVVRNGSHDGILVFDGCSAIVADNVLENVAERAIVLSSATTTQVAGNRIDGTDVGILTLGDDADVRDNRIDHAATAAIDLHGAASTVTGNRVRKCGIGLRLDSASDGDVISANSIKKSATRGIELNLGASGNLFLRNVVKKSGEADLLDGSGATNTYIENDFGTTAS